MYEFSSSVNFRYPVLHMKPETHKLTSDKCRFHWRMNSVVLVLVIFAENTSERGSRPSVGKLCIAHVRTLPKNIQNAINVLFK